MASAHVFLNPGAAFGSGRERWARVEPELERRLGPLEVEETRPLEDMARRVRGLLDEGEMRLVAAGGDGTVNLLVNAIMASDVGTDEAARAGGGAPTLGAVGLGSSNDYHKPYGASDTIEGMPAHVDFESARERDVIRIDLETSGRKTTRYALINASIGVTAAANARFSDPNWVVRLARPFSVDAAISAAILSVLARWRDITAAVATDGREAEMVSVTNLGVYKSPHFGGELRYDEPVERDDGLLGVALCEGMNALEVLRTVSGLRRGSFAGRPKTRTWTARGLEVRGDREFALEMDGEVVRARGMRLAVHGRRLECCV